MKLTLPLNIEVPQDPVKFNMGLMFRESLDQNSGMLFIFNEVGEKSFHMKDTKIPLDIAFINEEGIIESIKELEPLNNEPVYSNANVLYALEVNRGWFKENDVKIGDKIFESDLAQKRKQLRLKQIEKVKRFRQSSTSSIDARNAADKKQREKQLMKKEIKKELSQESTNIENSDGVTFARVLDIIGPSNMKPVVNNGLWKGTKQIIEETDCDCEGCGQDPCIKCGKSHHDVKEQVSNDDKKQDPLAGREQQIQRKQLMLDRQKLQLRRKAITQNKTAGADINKDVQASTIVTSSYNWRKDANMRINKILKD